MPGANEIVGKARFPVGALTLLWVVMLPAPVVEMEYM